MAESRTTLVKRNVLYSYISTIVTSIFILISRTLFIHKLGAGYLGVSGLFANVLGILSFSELGIGTAISFSLYKPIAENDKEKIKSLLHLYKSAYRLIAVIVTCVGLGIFPLLKYLLNTDIPMSEINVFYLIFLFNTVSSYFVSYKTSFVSACQKNYIITNIGMIGTVVVNVLQIAALLLGANYLVYLLIASIMGLAINIANVIYINMKFPIVREKDIRPLDKETQKDIWKNVRALIIHKVGDVSVHQTDNIIVSAFVSTTTVGLISNYTTINALIAKFTNGLFNSFTASFGNLIAKESKEHQYEIFKAYDLLGFWIFGFVMIAFITLSQPFITLWLGKELLLDDITVILFFLSIYLANMTLIPYNYKIAAGKFNEDKWVAFAQAVINIVVSIVAVKLIGLPGVYVGTIAQRMIVVVIRPYIVYRHVLNKNVGEYYLSLFFRTMLAIVLCFGLWEIKNVVLEQVTMVTFLIMVLITGVVPNLVFLLVFGRTSMFKDIVARIRKRKTS